MTLLLGLFLQGCVPAAAVGVPSPPTAAAPVLHDGLTLEELLFVDVRGAALATEVVRDDILALSDEDRADVAASMHVLARNCPYTRASIAAARAMHRVVVETPLGEIDGGYAQSDWRGLRRGLKAHVEALDAMGAHLPLPEAGDYLYREGGEDWLLDDGSVPEAADPLAMVLPLVGRVDRLVMDYDRATQERITRHRELVESRTGHPWVLSDHLWAWRDALHRLRPFVTEPAAQAVVADLLEVVESLGREGC